MRTNLAAVCAGGLLAASAATMPATAASTASPPTAPAQAAAADSSIGNLAPTPPMGWNSWNNFGCNIDEELIRETADALVASGMRDAGYEYVNIDDCWMAPERDAQGRLQPDPERFPNGIDALADYVHARGLKLGIYSSAGTATCQGLPASLGHEEVDAQSWADWGVDYLKYDNCNNQGVPAQERYQAMGDALAATGRPIVYSICEWGSNDPWLWGNEVGGDLWRTTGDISDNWGSVMSLLDQQVGLEPYSGPNGWNDPDMLEVGNGGMTSTEYRAHMSLWSLLNAPLIAGNDLRSMDDTTLALLTDPDVIAVNQDWGGIQGHKIADQGDLEVWAKAMSDGSAAVVLLNRGPSGAQVSTTASELGLGRAPAYTLRDVWDDTTVVTREHVRASVPSHGSRMFVVEPGVAAGHEPAVSAAVGTGTSGFTDPGESFTATVSVSNGGFTPVTDVEFTLDVPEGWTVEPQGSTTAHVVPPGRTARSNYTVSAPVEETTGTFDLTGSITYQVIGGATRELTGYGSVTIATLPRGERWISDLDPVSAEVGFGELGVDESVDGNPIQIGGVTYDKGIAPHAASEVTYYLGKNCSRFTADVGINDETSGRGSVTFSVLGDDREVLTETGVILGDEPAQHLDVDVSGVLVLTLVTGIGPDNNNYDHSEWAAAQVTCAGPVTTVTASPSETTDVPAGGSLEVTAQLRVGGTEPVTDVTFEPRVLAGWTVDSAAVEADRLEPGETLDGAWTITVPEDAAAGPVDVPVLATYRAVDDEPADPLIVERATVRVNVLPAGWLLTREAEAGVFSGAARISGCGACSGGQKAGFIGNGPDDHVTVTGVEVAAAGEYELIIDYLVDGTRSFFVSVNGGAGVEVALSGTSFSTPTSTTIPVSLVAGENTVRFSNDTAYAPDLDRIVVAESD